jgi:hypothetical protein
VFVKTEVIVPDIKTPTPANILTVAMPVIISAIFGVLFNGSI